MNRCIDRRLISLNKNLSKTFYQPLEPKNRIQRRLIFSDDRCIGKRSMSFFAKLCEIFHCHLRFFSNDLLYTNTNAQEINLSPTKMCTKRLISCSNIFCTKDRSRSKQFGQWREWSLDGLKIAFPSLQKFSHVLCFITFQLLHIENWPNIFLTLENLKFCWFSENNTSTLTANFSA